MLENISNTPYHCIFIFFLIVVGNYLGELFPCKVQKVLTENVFLKHFFAFLTMIFFVVLVDTTSSKELSDILSTSLILYAIFLLLINTNVLFFIISMVSLSIIYLLHLKKNEINDSNNHDESDEEKKKEPNKTNNFLEYANFSMIIVFLASTITGFLIYIGEKKIEYKGKFNYITFLFGKPSCRGVSPKTKFLESLLAAFK